jgi:hypothetical protein
MIRRWKCAETQTNASQRQTKQQQTEKGKGVEGEENDAQKEEREEGGEVVMVGRERERKEW